MTATVHPARPFHPVSVSPHAFWAQTAAEREETFKILRDEAPVSWQRPLEGSLMMPEQDGLWVVTRHADVQRVSKETDTFVSGQGVMIEEVPEDILNAAQSFLAMDAPEHPRLRRLVSAAFTPKQVKKVEAQIERQAKSIVDDLLETGDCDFVEHVSKRLPMWTIYEMLGLEVSKREEAAEAADGMVSWADPDVAAGREPGEVLNDSLVSLLTMGIEFAELRRGKPADDLMTSLVQAEVDGQRLTDEEIAAFFVLLSVAGNDTTRNTISLSMKALCDFPDQRALLASDYDRHIGTAIDEFVRWASPVMTFRRTAVRDTELGGQQISAGEWVVMFYSSANRDEQVFDRPEVFDITRSPNPHVAFGGGGPHFCMGNGMAKAQIRAIFRELLSRAPNLQVGEPAFLVGNFVHAVKSMPCTLNG